MANDVLRNFFAALDAVPTDTYPRSLSLLNGLGKLSQIQYGTVIGTGALLDVEISGNPMVVIAVNETAAVAAIKINGMATDVAVKIEPTPTVSYATDMITLDTDKFTIGVDADFNVVAEVVHWVALW